MGNYMLHVQESVNLTIYLYVPTMGQQRMLYIRKLVTNLFTWQWNNDVLSVVYPKIFLLFQCQIKVFVPIELLLFVPYENDKNAALQ